MKVALHCNKRGREILTELLDSLAALDASVLKEAQVLDLLTSLPVSYRW